jgi:hypothetical protein
LEFFDMDVTDANIPVELNIPAKLKELDQWVTYRNSDNKIPLTPSTLNYANTTDPSTWESFETALKRGRVGFVFTDGDPYVGIDLDSCRNPVTGQIENWALAEIDSFCSYSEVSPSGEGVHIFVRGKLPFSTGKKRGRCEIYEHSRYFTVTGNWLESSPKEIHNRQNEINGFCDLHFGEEQERKPSKAGSSPPLASTDVERRAAAYLDTIPGAISGQDGHGQTYYAACRLIQGFDLSTDVAMRLLSVWNQCCEPPWTEKELLHKVESADKAEGPRGYLLNNGGEVDLTEILSGSCVGNSIEDPGPIPERLLHIPGFVDEVMKFTLSRAPFPNVPLAFCGAIALQSFLAGRKVCLGDLRTNIYLLALARSGTGKEFPRKVNAAVLHQIGLLGSLGDKFASGEGIQDALVRTGKLLFQNDEMDGLLRQINLDRENRRESIPNILLTLFTSADGIYPIRVKAGQTEALHVHQPHVTLLGTATPKGFYEALSLRMLENGFFARMMIVDVDRRGAWQLAKSARDVPESILVIARWWAGNQPGSGDLSDCNPTPREIPLDSGATAAIEKLQGLTALEYNRAEDTGDECACAAWSRTCENALKLALIYACSENHEEPVICLPSVEWATELAMHQTRRQLFLAATYVAENPFHAECLKLLDKLRKAGGELGHSEMLRLMRIKVADFEQIIVTLVQQRAIEAVTISTATKGGRLYRII